MRHRSWHTANPHKHTADHMNHMEVDLAIEQLLLKVMYTQQHHRERASERTRENEKATSDERIKQRELKLTLSSQWLRSEEGHSFTALGWGYLNRAMRFFAFLSIFSRCRCCRCCCCATNKRSRKHTRRSSSILVDRVVG